MWTITDSMNPYNTERNQAQLEEFLVFSVMVAGKSAKQIEAALARLYERIGIDLGLDDIYNEYTPWELLCMYHNCGGDLASAMKEAGIGCHSQKSQTILDCMEKFTDVMQLATCPIDDLESIKGIGPKTSRFFILYTRENARVACLDTHIMRYLKEIHPELKVPSGTPPAGRYSFFEDLWLAECDRLGVSSSVYDVIVWRNKGDVKSSKEELSRL